MKSAVLDQLQPVVAQVMKNQNQLEEWAKRLETATQACMETLEEVRTCGWGPERCQMA
jgi:ABC-type transporter Mla subunit MlaD